MGQLVRARALAVVALLALCGCPAGTTPAQVTTRVVAVGGDLLQCAAADYQAGRDAITLGGLNWIGAILGAFQCLPQIVRDVEAQQAVALLEDPAAFMLCDARDELAVPFANALSRGARRRLVVAKVLGGVMNAHTTTVADAKAELTPR